jgi:anti-sigma regulatory factor (Ser/Thr protein kinase)
VLFCEDEDELAREVARKLGEAIRDGHVVVALATEAHLRALELEMERSGIDVHRARGDGSWTTYDALATLSRLIVGGSPDRESFQDLAGDILRSLAQRGRPVCVYGEMVALLWDAGHVGSAIELEDLWNELGRDLAFSLLCAYRLGSLVEPVLATSVERVCRAHSDIAGTRPGWPGPGTLEAARSFAGSPSAARHARRFVVETLLHWGCEDLADDAALVVSELATNAVLHARSGFTVSVSSLPPALWISVGDMSGALPTLRQASEADRSGRGLRLVAKVATGWGAKRLPHGKVVWAELRSDL